jgi:hypothetical protein
MNSKGIFDPWSLELALLVIFIILMLEVTDAAH